MVVVNPLLRFATSAGVLLTSLAACTADPPRPAKDPPAAKVDLEALFPDPDVEWLKRSKVATDDAGLIQFLRTCHGKDATPAEIAGLVAKLGAGPDADHDAAAKKLVEIGPVALPALRARRTDPDAALAERARKWLRQIEEAADRPLARPAMRLLVARRGPGAAEALLGFVPFASDPAAEEDVYYGLDHLAAKDPKVLDALANSLNDPQPARRAVAACLLGWRGTADQKKAVRELLKDPDPVVRLRAAQGFLAGMDASGVSALIELLDDPAVETCWQAEELLRWAAGETAPTAMVGAGDPKARRACRDAWREWAKDQAGKIDFAALEKEPRRPLLLLAYEREKGRVWLLGSDGATRCEWRTDRMLADAQYVPGGTVLTLHEQPVRAKPLLAERDRTGKVLWQHEDMRDPASIQRLANGRVFMAERQSVEPRFWDQIVTASGRKVSNQAENSKEVDGLVSLRHLQDGRILAGSIPRLTGSTGIIALFTYDPSTGAGQRLPRSGTVHSIDDRMHIEETPEGLLFTGLDKKLLARREIFERDPDGIGIWWLESPEAAHAARLRDGNTVVCLPNLILEFSLDKRVVADISGDPVPSVARPILQLVRLGFSARPADLDLATSVEARVRGLASPNARVRRIALQRLAEFGPEAAGVIPQIEPCLKDPDPSVRETARRAMLAAGVEEIPRLKDELKSTDPQRRLKALPLLRDYYRAPGVIPTIIEVLGDKDPKVRGFAASVLGGGGRNPQGRIPHWQVRGALRGHADVVVPALLKLSNDPDEGVRWRAIESLGMMGSEGKPAVPYLLKVLKGKDGPRATAARALGRIGPVTAEVVPALHEALKDPILGMRFTAAEALGAMRPAAKGSVKELIAADAAARPIDSRAGQQVRWGVMVALGHIREPLAEMIPFLLETIQQPVRNDSDVSTQQFAARSLV